MKVGFALQVALPGMWLPHAYCSKSCKNDSKFKHQLLKKAACKPFTYTNSQAVEMNTSSKVGEPSIRQCTFVSGYRVL